MAAVVTECPLPSPSSGDDSSTKDSPALAKNMKRSNKPLMEKRRRSRINNSLNQLKGLVLEAMKKDTSQYSKLEKADILEMTVRHLRNLQRHQLAAAATTDATVVGKYQVGFTECANEVGRYLGSMDGLSQEVRDRLMYHLAGCMQKTATIGGQEGMTQHHPQSAPQQLQHPAATATTVQGLPTTHPIHIQIPMATQSTSLPGAPTSAVQTLIAAPSMAGPSSRSPPSLASRSPPTLVATPSRSPPTQYVGAFQVVPSVSPTDLTAFMMQNGLVGNVTPLYVSPPPQQVPPQQQQQQQHHYKPAVPSTSTHHVIPTSSSHIQAPRPQPAHSHHAPAPQRHPVVKNIRDYQPHSPELAHAQQVIRDTLSEEKVWRPW